MLTSDQFNRTRRLALHLAGIELVERHRELLYRRCERLGVRDSSGFDDLLDAAESGDNEAGQRLIRLITTKFTGFFRHPRQFEAAAIAAFKAAQQQGCARLWSAGTATGEEAYSLAISLLEFFKQDEPPVTILATDVDQTALNFAAKGQYGARALEVLDPVRRTRFFTQAGQHKWVINPLPRRLVEFGVLNLASDVWSVGGPFDVIFCRNVLMYLEECHRYSVLERMASLLAPDGVLILDPSEHPGRASHLFNRELDAIYSIGLKPGQGRKPRAAVAIRHRGG
jgi:chemotaxis protein methyltransferase CheR